MLPLLCLKILLYFGNYTVFNISELAFFTQDNSLKTQWWLSIVHSFLLQLLSSSWYEYFMDGLFNHSPPKGHQSWFVFLAVTNSYKHLYRFLCEHNSHFCRIDAQE